MNAGRDVERLIATWLADEAPGRAPDRVLTAAGTRIDRTNQRRYAALRDLRIPWRPRSMFDRLAVAAAVVVVAIGGLVVGASLIAKPHDPAIGACPREFSEAEAIDTFAPGLLPAQRAWGITGGKPERIRPGVIAAYAGEDAGPENAPLSVITIDPETGRHCRLVHFAVNHLVQGQGATSLDWSPAGDALAVAVHDEEDEGTHGQVLIWTPDRLFRVWSGEGTPGVEWAPDGRRIAVWKAWPLEFPDPGPSETRVIYADGSPDRTYGIRAFTDSLRWSPDGSRWLVVRGTSTFEPSSASIVDLSDGRRTPIDVAVGHYEAIGWIDDGRVLLREIRRPEVTYFDVPLTAPANLSTLPIPDNGPTYESYELALSPDGVRVAYGTRNGIAILDVADGSVSQPVPVQVEGAAGDVGSLSWSPDGSQVIFYAASDPWIVDADGTDLHRLSTEAIFAFDDPWQPVPAT